MPILFSTLVSIIITTLFAFGILVVVNLMKTKSIDANPGPGPAPGPIQGPNAPYVDP